MRKHAGAHQQVQHWFMRMPREGASAVCAQDACLCSALPSRAKAESCSQQGGPALLYTPLYMRQQHHDNTPAALCQRAGCHAETSPLAMAAIKAASWVGPGSVRTHAGGRSPARAALRRRVLIDHPVHQLARGGARPLDQGARVLPAGATGAAPWFPPCQKWVLMSLVTKMLAGA